MSVGQLQLSNLSDVPFYRAYANDLWLSLFTAQMRFFQIACTLCNTPSPLQHEWALGRIFSLFATHMTIVYGWAFLQQLCRFATQNSFLPYTGSSYQHTTPIPHIALWRTRPFWAAHMMSKGMPLFCTEIHPTSPICSVWVLFAGAGPTLQRIWQ